MMRYPHLLSVIRAILLLLLLGLYVAANALPCEDSRCRTASCNDDGGCICDIPDPSTVLDGDRLFLGGRFCDEEMTMCDGTNSFWCEHGGKCEEIVQGEVYTCKCPRGYSGEHCELVGVPCGKNIFCFHGAECLVEEGDPCACPPGWKGSPDCLVPTAPSSTGSFMNSSTTGLHRSGQSGPNGVLVFFLVLFSLAAVWAAAVYSKNRLLDRKQRAAPEVQRSSQRQTYRMLDEQKDDDNSTETDTIRDGNSHL